MEASALESAIKALEIAIRSAESRADALSWWLNFWVALVVLGVVVEVFVVIKEYRHSRKEYLRGIIHSPSKPSVLDLLLNLLGAGLVAIGVAGELVIGLRIGAVEAELRDESRKLVGFLNVKTGNALDSAEKLRNENLRLEKELTELKKSTLPRTLNIEAVAKLLARYEGTRVTVATVHDFEARRTALLVMNALRKAKWQVIGGAPRVVDQFEPFSDSGIWVEIGATPPFKAYPVFVDAKRQSDATTALIGALKANGIVDVARRRVSSMLTDPGIWVYVGLKPMPGEPKFDLHNP